MCKSDVFHKKIVFNKSIIKNQDGLVKNRGKNKINNYII